MWRVLILTLALLGGGSAWTQEDRVCWAGGDSTPQYVTVDEYRVILRQSIVDAPKEWEVEVVCTAEVVSPTGVVVFRAVDMRMEISDVTGQDVSGDGLGDIVLEGYSGGAHCCWTYWIVSLPVDANSLKVLEIENERGVGFLDIDGDGRMEILTQDGAFDYFDGLSHAETTFPDVIFKWDGNELIDGAPNYLERYDGEITNIKRLLLPSRLEEFQRIGRMCDVACDEPDDEGEMNTNLPDDRRSELRKTKALVQSIVFAYLYSGREDKAWEVLSNMWPPHDLERFKELVIETHKHGVLRHLSKAHDE